ncbi:MAG TPA: aminomethyltransferase family protein [Actinomycetota bacterium]|nr:aminomethyltransferase family protein [Actinomycetota bacterium]
MSVGTAFHPRTSQLNQKMAWGEWSGYFSAQVYADFHDIEYNAIREAAALIDVTPLYKYAISGPDATRLVDRVMTRDASKLAIDQVMYTPWCDERGKVIDDGTVARRKEREYFWTAADASYRWFVLNAHGLDVQIEDVTDTVAGLAVQGPKSRDLLEVLTGQDWKDLRYFRHRRTEIAGIDVNVTRTGYTGDLGYELWVDAGAALELWDAVWEGGEAFGIRAAGIHALDVTRVEAGLILAEVEYTSARHAISAEQEYSPFEISLGRLVDFGKADFVGKHALELEQVSGGPARRLVGLELDWSGIETMFAKHDQPPAVSAFVHRDPVPVYRQGKRVGRATSVTWGPTIKKMVGFGSLPPSLASPGTRLSVEWTVEGERGRVGASVDETPFLDLPRKRA